jgi:hypothetical protein
MFHATSARLVDWATETIGEPIAALTPPAGGRAKRGVSLYLLDLCPQPRPNGAKVVRLQVSLRYLITAWAERAEDGQALLGRMAIAAMTHPELEVESDPPPASLWAALGAPPQPCLLVRTTAWHELPRKTTPVVTGAVFETTVIHSTDRSSHRA